MMHASFFDRSSSGRRYERVITAGDGLYSNWNTVRIMVINRLRAIAWWQAKRRHQHVSDLRNEAISVLEGYVRYTESQWDSEPSKSRGYAERILDEICRSEELDTAALENMLSGMKLV